MEIEYLKIFQEIRGNDIEFGLKDYEELKEKRLRRTDLMKKFSFAVPCEEAITEIVKYSPIIEIGAGTGYWGYLINKAGGEIVCFDNYSRDREWEKRYQKKFFGDKWFSVKRGNVKTIDDYPDHTLFLCWVEYCGNYGIEALKKYKGKYFIHIGEGYGGCTATDDFFDYLEKYFTEIKMIDIPKWYGVHDYLEIYERKRKI